MVALSGRMEEEDYGEIEISVLRTSSTVLFSLFSMMSDLGN